MPEITPVQRLREAVFAVAADDLREAIRAIDEVTVRALPNRSRPLVSQLRRSTEPATLLRKIPDISVIAAIADGLSEPALVAVREALGDAADDPTAEQLKAGVDQVVADFDVTTVRVMLAVVAIGDAEAADKCTDLLEHDERFALEVVAPTPTPTREAKAPASDEVQARRRERKEAERTARQKAKAVKPPPAKPKPVPPPPPPPAPPAFRAPVVARRAPTLTPEEASAFDVGDPLVGSVVIAVVPFDDPHSQFGAKARPCIVVGTAPGELLVRPGYSDGGLQSRRWQSHALRDWAAAGLTKPSFIQDEHRAIPRSDASEPIGRLTDDDWNGLW